MFVQPIRPAASLIPRHGGNGNPKIFPEEEYGKEKPKGSFYTRTTTFIDVLDDKKALQDWKLRLFMEGVTRRPGLLEDYLGIEDPQGTGKSSVDKLVTKALDAADQNLKAETGDLIHSTSELADMGQAWEHEVPPDLVDDIAAYLQAMKELGARIVSIEEFCVNDEFKIAGTFDRAYEIGGELYIGDLKSGRVDLSRGKFGMQLAAYAGMKRYDPVTYKRSPLEFGGRPVSTKVGYIVHVPQYEGRVDVIPVDLERGHQDLLLAQKVREYRAYWARKTSWHEPVVSVNLHSEEQV